MSRFGNCLPEISQKKEGVVLRNVPALLGPDFLKILRAMGHGDEIAIVDANYPADAHAQRLVRLDGHGAAEILDAVLTLMPLDHAADAAFRPCAFGDCARIEPIYEEFAAIIDRHERDAILRPLEGEAFYERVRSSYAVAASGERRLYGNIILRKGIIPAPL